MKKALYPLIIALACLATSCANDTEQIKAAAQGYLDAMGNYKPTEARAFASQETQDITLSYYEKILATMDSSLYADNMPATITLGNIAIEDSIATVSYHKRTPTKQQDGSLTLVKRKHTWLAFDVIQIPSMMNVDSTHHRRVFTEEEIADMRKNGAHKAESMPQ